MTRGREPQLRGMRLGKDSQRGGREKKGGGWFVIAAGLLCRRGKEGRETEMAGKSEKIEVRMRRFGSKEDEKPWLPQNGERSEGEIRVFGEEEMAKRGNVRRSDVGEFVMKGWSEARRE